MSVQLGSAHGKVIIDASGVKPGTDKAAQGVRGLADETKGLTGVLKGLVGPGLLLKMGREAYQLGKESVLLSSRVGVLGVVTTTLGRNAGYTEKEIRALEEAIQSKGITTQASRQAVAQMVQAEIDLANATDLARLAQDTAVISGDNSSQAFERLVTVVSTGNILMARRMGLMVDFQGAYKREAQALGISTEALSERDKLQIRVNEVMRVGTRIAGSYEAAMEMAGKKMSSYARHWEELQLASGERYQKQFGAMIDWWTKQTDQLTDTIKAENKMREALENGIITRKEYNHWLNRSKVVGEDLVDELDELARREERLEEIAGRNVTTYEGYILKMLEVKNATGELSDEKWAFYVNLVKAEKGAGFLANTLGGLSEETWEAAKAAGDADRLFSNYSKALEETKDNTEDLEAAQDRLRQELDELKLRIDGPVGKAFDDFHEKETELTEQANELRDEIEELENRQWLTAAQKEELEETKIKLGDVTTAIGENANEHHRATGQILVDLMMQRASLDGVITQVEYDLINAWAHSYGFIDDETWEMQKSVDEAWRLLEEGNVVGAREMVDEYTEAVLGIPRSITTTITAKFRQEGFPPSSYMAPYWLDPSKRAVGGPVVAGSPYIIGEKGPELFVPKTSGTIVPADQTRGMMRGAADYGGASPPGPPTLGGDVSGGEVHHHWEIGVLVADERGISELERRLRPHRVMEDERRGV